MLIPDFQTDVQTQKEGSTGTVNFRFQVALSKVTNPTLSMSSNSAHTAWTHRFFGPLKPLKDAGCSTQHTHLLTYPSQAGSYFLKSRLMR